MGRALVVLAVPDLFQIAPRAGSLGVGLEEELADKYYDACQDGYLEEAAAKPGK